MLCPPRERIVSTPCGWDDKPVREEHAELLSECSKLLQRTLIAINELAGHRSIRTTMRYMHLSPSHKEKAIELLEARAMRTASR